MGSVHSDGMKYLEWAAWLAFISLAISAFFGEPVWLGAPIIVFMVMVYKTTEDE